MGFARILSIGLAASLCMAASRAGAEQFCDGLPPRSLMPKEAMPLPVPIPDWQRQIAALSKEVASRDLSKVRLVFVGDSITRGWEPTTWQLFWSAYNPLNLGLSGDLTQGVLWRLRHGEWPAALRPDVAVVLIGTNNASWHSRAEDTALGVAEIIRTIRARSPDTKILLLGILPRGADRSTAERPINAQVNTLIRKCADDRTVFYAEPGNAMVDAAGKVSIDVLFDYLHPTMVGYAILGAGIYPQVRGLEAHRE